MTSRIAALAIDASDPRIIADFWCAVLGWSVLEQDDDVISIGGGAGQQIDVLAVPEAKTVKNRLHLDLRADGSSTAAELARLLALGARRVDVGQADDVTWTVLADPEGNEFCLLSRTVQEAEA
ncbi:VOC family protein [Modestobacter sp. SYSU DS0290]